MAESYHRHHFAHCRGVWPIAGIGYAGPRTSAFRRITGDSRSVSAGNPRVQEQPAGEALDRYDSIIVAQGTMAWSVPPTWREPGSKCAGPRSLRITRRPRRAAVSFTPAFRHPVAHSVSHFSGKDRRRPRARHAWPRTVTAATLPNRSGLSTDGTHVIVHADSVQRRRRTTASAYRNYLPADAALCRCAGTVLAQDHAAHRLARGIRT